MRSSSGDIDITIILVGAFGKNENQIFIDNGSGKHRKTIRIDSSKLTEKEMKALVGFHDMSGDDFVSSFMRKSKKIWNIVVKDDELINFFYQLAEGEEIEQIYEIAEKFVCQMYKQIK